MSVVKKNNALNAPEKRYDEKLYIGLSAMNLTQGGYSVDKLGEDMSVVEQSI